MNSQEGQLSPSGVFIAADFRMNLIIDRYDPIFADMRASKLKHLRSANSEDAVTWNIFRSLRQIAPRAWLPGLWQHAFPSRPCPTDLNPVVRLVHAKRRHFHNTKRSFFSQVNLNDVPMHDHLTDDSKESQVRELGESLKEIELRGAYFGRFTLTIVIYDSDLAKDRQGTTGKKEVGATGRAVGAKA